MSTLASSRIISTLPQYGQVVPLHNGASPLAPTSSARVAVIYQALESPTINGVRKPARSGGYRDSGADIAFNLALQPDIEVVTPQKNADATQDNDWCFPDTEEGILAALDRGVTHLWANTSLFELHPLQNSQKIQEYQDRVNIIGQPPCLVELYDDKDFVNSLLRKNGSFTMPQACCITTGPDIEDQIDALELSYPIVGKPIRGRGSFGVKACFSKQELLQHVFSISNFSPIILLEEFLSGEEATVTVMPPSLLSQEYWAMPIVKRFSHIGGIAPFGGVVPVTSNSRVVEEKEYAADPRYNEIARECEAVAKLLRLTAPTRIDIRRFDDRKSSKFALFDVNMKPSMTGPGRPGRENQASLTAMAAAELGWDYSQLLREMLLSSFPLRQLRHIKQY